MDEVKNSVAIALMKHSNEARMQPNPMLGGK